MPEPSTLAEKASKNGHHRYPGLGSISLPGTDVMAAALGAAREVAGGVARTTVDAVRPIVDPARRYMERAFTANLDDRDSDYLRENLPLSWLVATLWYRAEVRNVGRIPERGPVLIVGNHTGGQMSPETFIFGMAFSTYFGVERAFYQLAHNLVLASPLGLMLRRFGTVSASPEHARLALSSGAALLVYPGGDHEVNRPSWEGSKVDFGGRKGWIRLALEQDVPLVPAVTIGGQETALFLSRGETLAKMLGLNRPPLRAKVLPIAIVFPWGLWVGGLPLFIPLPAKVTISVLEPINLRETFGEDPDIDEIYDHVTGLMQTELSQLAAERRLPVIG